jgi:hypothetical protein
LSAVVIGGASCAFVASRANSMSMSNASVNPVRSRTTR